MVRSRRLRVFMTVLIAYPDRGLMDTRWPLCGHDLESVRSERPALRQQLRAYRGGVDDVPCERGPDRLLGGDGDGLAVLRTGVPVVEYRTWPTTHVASSCCIAGLPEPHGPAPFLYDMSGLAVVDGMPAASWPRCWLIHRAFFSWGTETPPRPCRRLPKMLRTVLLKGATSNVNGSWPNYTFSWWRSSHNHRRRRRKRECCRTSFRTCAGDVRFLSPIFSV